jgi:hypothetical protein
VIAADGLAHLPILGAVVPGPTEFIGTAAALLLASRYFVTKVETRTKYTLHLLFHFPSPSPSSDFFS